MNATVNRAAFERALAALARVINEELFVLLSADGAALTLTYATRAYSARVKVTATVNAPGLCIVALEQLARFAAAAPGEQLRLKLDGARLSVDGGAARATFVTRSLDMHALLQRESIFPARERLQFMLSLSTLREMCNWTTFAAQQTSSALACVQFCVQDGFLRMAAKDGFRLSVAEAELPFVVGDARGEQFVVSVAALSALEKLTTVFDRREMTTVVCDDHRIGFRCENAAQPIFCLEFAHQLPNARFPSVDSLLNPPSNAFTLQIERKAWLAALTATKPFWPDPPCVRLDIQNGAAAALNLFCRNESGQIALSVPAAADGATRPLTLHVNAKFLLEALTHAAGETLDVCFESATLPLRISPLHAESALQRKDVHLLMSMTAGGGDA